MKPLRPCSAGQSEAQSWRTAPCCFGPRLRRPRPFRSAAAPACAPMPARARGGARTTVAANSRFEGRDYWLRQPRGGIARGARGQEECEHGRCVAIRACAALRAEPQGPWRRRSRSVCCHPIWEGRLEGVGQPCLGWESAGRGCAKGHRPGWNSVRRVLHRCDGLRGPCRHQRPQTNPSPTFRHRV
ncbi:hypothetical protein D3C86_1652190 [compost metagenome]